MIIQQSILRPPVLSKSWEDLWKGPDKGVICSWMRGIEKSKQSESLRQLALKGELPELPWKGGGKAVKSGRRLGSLQYLAMWQGLRGEDLHVDMAGGQQITCALTGVLVTFTADIKQLAAFEDGGDT